MSDEDDSTLISKGGCTMIAAYLLVETAYSIRDFSRRY